MQDEITINTPNSEVWSHLAQAVTLPSTDHAIELLSHCGSDRIAYCSEMLERLAILLAAGKFINDIENGNVAVLTVGELLEAIEQDDTHV